MFQQKHLFAAAPAFALLAGCSLMVADQTQCESSSDCTLGAVCSQGLCTVVADAGAVDAGAADAGADAGAPDGGADAGTPWVARFSVTGVATPRAGEAVAVTVTAQTANQEIAAGYRGTVRFSSTGAARVPATLPEDHAFAAADEGKHTFTVTFFDATSQRLTVTDAADPRIAGSMHFTVQAEAPAKVVLSGVPASVAAGTASSLTVSVVDKYDNPIPGFAGSVAFTSSDARAEVPASYQFLAAENGSHSFPGVVLKTAGSQTLTAQVTLAGSALSGVQTIVVHPAGADHFAVSGIGTGIPMDFLQSVTVIAQDAYGNQVAGYRGTIRFTTEDSGATLPADYTFETADNGARTFTHQVSFSKSGTFTVAATDISQSSLRGAQSNIVVLVGAATSLTVTGIPSSVTAGTAYGVRVTAVDKNGTRVTSYSDTVTLTSSDDRATFAPDSLHTFAGGDGGAFDFTVTFRTAGSQSISAADAANRSGAQNDIAVAAAAASALAVSGVPSPITARATANSLAVAARDQYGNTDQSYRGTVRFTSSDPHAVLPGNYVFNAADNGSHTFAGVSFRSAGIQSITATDVVHSNINGKQDPIDVEPGAVASVTFVQQPGNVVVGAALGTVQVRLADQDGNVATNATAQVALSLVETPPSGAALSGATTAAPSGGLATFTGLSVDRAGTYSLRATVAGVSVSGISNDFEATCAPGYSGSDCKACANGYKASTDTPGACIAICSEPNPCTSPPADTCDGNNLVRRNSPGSCETSASAPYYLCTYTSTSEDCATATANGICFTDSSSIGHCIEDPCHGDLCADQASDCEPDGVTRNTYAASCVPTGVGTHRCDQAKTSTLCADQVCYLGACSPASAPAAGELVVSEVMHTPAEGSGAGRWLEVTNTSSKLLNLAGLSVEDGVGHSFSLPASPPALVAAGGRYVFGEVAASGVNAVLPILGSFAMDASGGDLQLKVGGTAVAALAWDSSFPSAAGAAMNLSAKFVNPLAALRAFHWCSATTAMSGGGADRGTPGGANIDCAQVGTTLIAADHAVSGCKTDRPASLTASAGSSAGPIFGLVYEPNATDLSRVANDYYPFIQGQVGFGATGTDPSGSGWTWAPAAWNTGYNAANSDSDELSGSLLISLAGQYSYGYRFRLVDDGDAQGPWAYCDADGRVAAAPPISTGFPIVAVVPTIASTSPSEPKLGTALTIAGAGFTEPTTVAIGGVAQNAVVTSPTQLDLAAVDLSTLQGDQPLVVTSNGQSATATVHVVP
jgi:hypothetical protein